MEQRIICYHQVSLSEELSVESPAFSSHLRKSKLLIPAMCILAIHALFLDNGRTCSTCGDDVVEISATYSMFDYNPDYDDPYYGNATVSFDDRSCHFHTYRRALDNQRIEHIKVSPKGFFLNAGSDRGSEFEGSIEIVMPCGVTYVEISGVKLKVPKNIGDVVTHTFVEYNYPWYLLENPLSFSRQERVHVCAGIIRIEEFFIEFAEPYGYIDPVEWIARSDGIHRSIKFIYEEDSDDEGNPGLGSFQADWTMGSADVVWKASDLNACIEPSSVIFYELEDDEVIPEVGGHKQLRVANNGLVDVFKSGSTLAISFYPESSVGTQGQDDFYAVSGTPTRKVTTTQTGSVIDYKKYANGLPIGEWELSQNEPHGFSLYSLDTEKRKIKTKEISEDETTVTNEVWDASVNPEVMLEKHVITTKEFSWGTETLSETEYIDGNPRTTSYSYYGDGDGVTGADTWYGKQKRVLYPDGNWIFHQYTDTDLPEEVTAVTWGPFKSTAAPTSVPTSGTGYVKNISYQDGTEETYTDGFLTAKSRWTTSSAGTFAGSGNLTVETSETWYGPGANDKLTTTSYSSSESLLATVNPDGTCQVYEHEKGTYNPATGDFTPAEEGTDKRTTVFHSRVNADGTDQEWVAFQSTATETIENAAGQTLQERELVYDGTSFNNVLSTTRHTYVDGNLTETWRDGDVIYSAVYAGGELQSSTDEYGAVTTTVETRNFSVTTVDDGEVVHTSESETDGAGRISTQTDQGLETGYAYSTAPGGGEIVTTTLPSGATSIAESYLDGHPKSTTGTAEIATAYDYSAANGELITTQTTSDGEGHNRSVVTKSDMMGRTKMVTRPKFGGGTTVSAYAYNAAGQLEAVTLDDSSVAAPQAVTYNAMGAQELSGLDMDGGRLSTTAGSPDRVSKSESCYATQDGKWYQVNKLDRLLPTGWVTLQETWNRVDGRETITKGPGGRTITTTTEVDRPNKTVTITTLDSEIGTPSKAVYKGGMTLVETQEPWQYGTANKTTYHYDANGRLETVTDALGRSTGFTYQPQGTNGAGQEATRTLPGNATISTTYNVRGQVEVEEGSGTYWEKFLYNGFGELSRLGTSRGSGIDWTDFIPDWGTGLLAQKKIAGADVADYTYNAAGWLETRTLPQGPTTTTYGHTKAGEVNSIDYSDSTPDVTGMLYDRGGRLTNVTDAAGDRTITYSDFDQRANETWSGSGILSGYSVSRGHTANRRDSLGAGGPGGFTYPGVTYGYNSTSKRLETISQGSLTVTYTPQAGMSLPQAVTSAWSGGATMTRTLGYDALGRATHVTNSVGSTVISAHGTQAAPIQYDNAGRRHIIPREDGTNWTYGYNDRNEVAGGSKTFGTTTPVPGHQFTYDYDGIGNRLTATMGGSSVNYTANDKNQYSAYSNPTRQWITGEAATDANVFVNGAWAWRNGKFFAKAIDLGNAGGPVWKAVTVESKLLPGGGNMLVATGGGHVLAPPQNASPGYDANGNVTGDGLWNYTWDGENRLVGVETVSAVSEAGQRKIAYAYDFEGRRIQSTRYTKSGTNWMADPAGPTVMLYDGWNLITERNSSADKKYLWGLDLSGTLGQAGGVGGLLAFHNAGQTDSVAYDANGNVTALVNASSGAVDGSYEYGPFGEPLVVTGPMAEVNPFRFSTKYQDDETGLVWFPGNGKYPGRYYDPKTGRWLSRDAFGEAGGLNLYGYCLNDPVNRFDPFGLTSELPERLKCCKIKKVIVNFTSTRPGPNYDISKDGMWNHPTGRTFLGTVTVECRDKNVWTGSMQTGGMRTRDSTVREGDDSATPAGDFTIQTSRPGKGFPISISVAATGRGSITMHYADYQGSHGCPTLTNSNEWGELIELMKLNNETFKISSAPIRIQYSGVSPQGNRGNGRNDPPVVPVPLPVPPTP